MAGLLTAIAGWFLASLISRVLLGAGLSIATYVTVSGFVDDALFALTSGLSGLGQVGVLLYIAGIGEAVSILGGAITAVISIMAVKTFIVRSN